MTSGGTIPDRGLFGVFVAGESQNARVGELDEEMVYESRVNDVFTLGTTSWRIVEITHDRVNVRARLRAARQGAVLARRRPRAACRARRGARQVLARGVDRDAREGARQRLREAGLDDNAAGNLLAYLAEQREATGTLPTDSTLTVERGRDEVGDWRVILHSPYGMQVHAPWALAVNARIRERLGVDGSAVASDDGIIARVPDADRRAPGRRAVRLRARRARADRDRRGRRLGAVRLALPRVRGPGAAPAAAAIPDRRTPLWQQRQRSAQLLEVARRYPTFPIILETLREVLQDVYDVPALLRIARSIGERRIRLVETETTAAVAVRARPAVRLRRRVHVRGRLAARRAPGRRAVGRPGAAVASCSARSRCASCSTPTSSRSSSARCSGSTPSAARAASRASPTCCGCSGPLDAAEVAARLQLAAPSDDRRVDLGRDAAEAARRPRPPSSAHLAALDRARRVIPVTIAGARGSPRSRTPGACATRSASALPVGIPTAFLEPLADPLGDLVARYARTHGPFTRGCRRRAARRRHRRRAAHAAAPRVAGARRRAASSCPTSTTHRRRRRRRDRVVRHRGAAAAADAVARGDPRQRRARLAGGVRALPPGLAARHPAARGHRRRRRRDRAARRRADPGERMGVARAAGARRRLHARRCSTSSPRPARCIWSGHGALPGRDGWIALHPAEARPSTLAAARGRDRPGSPRGAAARGARAGGAYFAGAAAAARRAPRTSSRSSRRCGASPGRARHERHVRPGAHARSAAAPRPIAPPARASGADLPRRGGADGRGIRPPATARDRRTLVAAARRPSPMPTLRATAAASLLLDRYGVVTRGLGAGRGPARAASRRRTACSPASKRPGTAAAATSSRSSARRSSRHPPPSTGCGSSPGSPDPAPLRGRHPGRDRSRQPLRRRARLARARGRRPPARPQGRGARRARRRRARALPRARRQVRARLHRRRGACSPPPRATSPRPRAARRLDTLTIEQVNGEFVYGTGVGRALREAGFVESPRGLTLRRLTAG